MSSDKVTGRHPSAAFMPPKAAEAGSAESVGPADARAPEPHRIDVGRDVDAKRSQLPPAPFRLDGDREHVVAFTDPYTPEPSEEGIRRLRDLTDHERSLYTAYLCSQSSFGRPEPTDLQSALLRHLAAHETRGGVRKQALSGVARAPVPQDVSFLESRLEAGWAAGRASAADFEALPAAMGLAVLVAQAVHGHERVRSRMEAIAAQATNETPIVGAFCFMLARWARAPHELAQLAALEFPDSMIQLGPDRYRAQLTGWFAQLDLLRRQLRSETASDRIDFLAARRVPLMIGPDLHPAFNGTGITLRGLADIGGIFEEITHAQQILGWERADLVPVRHPSAFATREAFAAHCVRMEAEAQCAPFRVLEEIGQLGLPQPNAPPADQRLRHIWLEQGRDAARAHRERELLEGAPESTHYRKSFDEWWEMWKVAKRVEGESSSSPS